MRTNAHYDNQFKSDAVELLKRTDRTFVEVAEDLGVNVATLRYWYYGAVGTKKKKRRAGETASVTAKSETVEQKSARLERENAALRKRVDSLEMDREILKKAAAFFAKESE